MSASEQDVLDTSAPEVDTQQEQEKFSARSVFMVETTGLGVTVKPISYRDDTQQAIDITGGVAIFPNLSYALEQIEQMKQAVIAHFERAAQVGVQVIASNGAAQAASEKAQDSEEQTDEKDKK